MTPKLDLNDKEILRQLQNDALITTKKLATLLNLSSTAIYERVRRLENDGIIKKYVALIDKELIGKNLTVFCNVSLKEHAREAGVKFVNDIVQLEEVMECYNISGEYDFMIKIIVGGMPEYQAFLMNKLASLDNIGSTHSIFVMGEIKHETALAI